MSFRKTLLSSCAVLVGGTLVLASSASQCAEASREDNFRSFRDSHPDIDRHSARQMFLTARRIDRAARNDNGSQVAYPMLNVTNVRPNVTDGYSSNLLSRHERIEQRRANHVRNQSMQTLAQNVFRTNNGVDLDLTSSVNNITLGRNLFTDEIPSVTITVGGAAKTLTAGSQVTPAEYVAVKQVLADGSQKVTLAGNGSATGGNVDLAALTSGNDVMRASNLVIAANVTTSGDFGKGADFKLLGNLDNYGTLQAFSTDGNVRAGAIRANDISNHSNALISSSVDLTLDASRNFRNEGTIVSSEGLTITAGSVSNKGTMTATTTLSLNSGSVNNSGLIQSTGGDLHLNGLASADLIVKNVGGTLSAVNGAVNLRDAAFDGTFNSTISGGDLFSREVNVNAGAGTANVNVGKLTGIVNETGANAHVYAETDLLSIGSVCLTGDPTYYNSTGSIAITGNISVPDAVTIVASGDITSAAGVTVQAGSASQGKNITLIAGADFDFSGGENVSTVPDPGKEGSVFLSGKSSKTGGSINLGNGTTLDSRPTSSASFASAGDVQMYAFAKGKSGGYIVFPTSTVETGGAMNGPNGNVELVAGAAIGDSIQIGTIVTSSNGTAGKLNAVTSQPTRSGNGTVQYDPSGALVGTTKLVAGKSLTTASVVFVGQSSFNDTVNVRAGKDIDVSGGLSSDVSISLNSGGAILQTGSNELISPSIAVIAKGDMGSSLTPFRIAGTNISIITGGSAFLTSSLIGPIVLSGSVGDTLRYLNPTEDVQVQDFSGTTLDVTSKTVLIDNLTLNSGLKNLILDIRGSGDVALNLGGVDSLTVKSAGNLGTQANPFLLSDIKSVVLESNKGAYIGVGGKTGTTIDVTTFDDALIGAANKKTVLTSATSSNGAVVYVGSSNVTVDGAINAKTGIVVQSTGASSSKIAIKENSSLNVSASTDGISFIVGPTLPVNTDPQKNVVTLGTVVFRGPGVKASAPTNTLTAQGSGFIQILNGYKQNSVTLGGGVTMLSVGP